MKSGPDAWGPHAWKFLHYVSLGYPDKPTKEDKEKYKSFFLLLQDVLPCAICREHFKDNYSKLPLTDDILSSRDKLIKWVIDLHNIVNEMKNKPTVSYDKAIDLMMNNFEDDNINNNNNNNNNNKDNNNNNNNNNNDNNDNKDIKDNNNKKNNSHVDKSKYDTILSLVLLLLSVVIIYTLFKKK